MSPPPQELMDAIVTVISDKETLLACSLTSTSLVNASQRRLFRSISLRDVPSYDRFAGLLAESPHLGQYVRSLSLDIGGIPAHWTPLESILSTTTQVEQLVIDGNRGEVGTKSELRLIPSLIEFISLKPLRCVALMNLSDVPSAIVALVLKTCAEVCLLATGPIVPADDDSAPALPSSTLWHLDIAHPVVSLQARIISFLIQPRQSGYLKSLTHLALAYDNSAPCTSLLAACAPTLEFLDINYRKPFVLPALPRLRHLELRILADQMASYFIAIPFVLRSLRASPHWAKLTVAFRERDGEHLFHWGESGRSFVTEWPALEKMFCERHAERLALGCSGDKHATSFEVHFSLRVSRDEPARYAAFVADMQKKLPRSYAAGILTFSLRAAFIHPLFCFSSEQ
ncbi:hypothetical protein C8R45DRAFT_1010788 [Mycena sanguinolenta]|nr:hypothetical protein C8R45DRAFT_1010788 [Mycena sanguinolenta]